MTWCLYSSGFKLSCLVFAAILYTNGYSGENNQSSYRLTSVRNELRIGVGPRAEDNSESSKPDPEYYLSRVPFTIGVGVNYSGHSISVARSIPNLTSFSNSDRKTNISHFRIVQYNDFVNYEIYYNKWENLILVGEGGTDVLTENIVNEEEEFLGMRSQIYGANVLFNMNPDDFSISALSDQSERQTESGHSFLALFDVASISIKKETPLVDVAQSDYFGDDTEIREVQSSLASCLLGWGGTATAGKTFAGLMLLTGRSVQKNEFIKIKKVAKTGWDYRLFGRMSLGFHGEEFFFGGTVLGDYYYIQSDALRLWPTRMQLEWFFGGYF